MLASHACRTEPPGRFSPEKNPPPSAAVGDTTRYHDIFDSGLVITIVVFWTWFTADLLVPSMMYVLFFRRIVIKREGSRNTLLD